MKSYLSLVGVGLWLLGSCSTADPSPEENPNTEGISVDYTVITRTGNNLRLSNYMANAEELEFLAEGPVFSISDTPLIWNQDAAGFSAVLPGENCAWGIIWLDPSGGSLLEQEALSGLNACEIEIQALAHSAGKVFIAYSGAVEGEGSFYFGLRALDMTDGAYLDIALDALPVDLDSVGDRIYVLTRDEGASSLNTIEIFTTDNLEFIHGTEVGYEAELLMRIGSDRLLLGFPDAHKELSSNSLQVLDNVRYQEGTEPGFSSKQPIASSGGDELIYRYQMREDQEIGAIYHLPERTAVLYDFENYLSPDQRDFEFDVGTTTATGFDADNAILIIGYQKASSQGGGILRIQTEPSLRFIDQADLANPPFAILTQTPP